MKKYQIIYADPPWQYADQKGKDPKLGGITYPTMPLEEIKSLRVQDISDKDCMLFLWATMPLLKEALEVIEAWEFRYITCAFCWVKKNPNGQGIYSGLGHWVNGNAELCLMGKKGKPQRIAKNVKQIIQHPRQRHSKKPDEVRDRIVKLMGDIPRIELFTRPDPQLKLDGTNTFDGWSVWGNEVESDIKLSLDKHISI